MYYPTSGPEGLPAHVLSDDDSLMSGVLPDHTDISSIYGTSSVQPRADRIQPFALLFIDLDQFRVTQESGNQNLNHEVIEQYRNCLLGAVMDAVRSRLREDDLVSQVSATEFIIAIRSDPLGNVPHVASRLAKFFKKPIYLENQQFQVSGNIGVSFYPEDGQDTNVLIQKAHLAMQEAKSHDAWAIRFHPSETSLAIRRRFLIEQSLKHPDLPHQLEMRYQPQWDSISDRLYGFESLVRWYHPTLGEISPDEFIPIAEELGCIHRITHLAIAKSLQLTREILEQQDVILKPSVNISAQEFKEFRRFYDIVDQELQHSQLPSNLLTIELTERVFLQPSDQIIAHLQQLRDRGICIALDDFGTGFSCLSYLLDLPLNILKIDRAFVQTIDQDPRRRGIVQAIVAMAKSLDMRCVAEGVETPGELSCLQELGCAITQGHIVSPALSESSFLSLCANCSHLSPD